jgi:hypothetical protein
MPLWSTLVVNASTSLEDRYRSVRLDVLIHTCWSRASDDPPLTVSALGSSRHLALVWPADLPLRRSFQHAREPARSLASLGFRVRSMSLRNRSILADFGTLITRVSVRLHMSATTLGSHSLDPGTWTHQVSCAKSRMIGNSTVSTVSTVIW